MNPRYKLLSLVMPAYNEENTLAQVVSRIQEVDLGIAKELIIIDDGSKDRTAEIARSFHDGQSVRFVQMPKNSGKSQAVKFGISHTNGDLVVIHDADLEFDPADLAVFVAKFQNDEVDLVYGNRFGKHNQIIYWQNWFGNRLLSFVSSLFTFVRAGMWTNDMEVCYKMTRGEIFREIGSQIVSKSMFGLEPEITARFAKYKLNGKHLRFMEIPLTYRPRSIAEGKKMNAVRDGIKALGEIVRFNLFS